MIYPTLWKSLHLKSLLKKCKSQVKREVIKYWSESIESEAQEKSTLAHLNKVHSSPHLIWKACAHDPRAVRRANTKARLLSGTYILQSNRAAFNQTKITTCPLCERGDEDIHHFLISCEALEPVRKSRLACVLDAIPQVYKRLPYIISSPRHLVQIVLDPSHPLITEILPLKQHEMIEIEKESQILCYKLHQARCKYLNDGQVPAKSRKFH